MKICGSAGKKDYDTDKTRC